MHLLLKSSLWTDFSSMHLYFRLNAGNVWRDTVYYFSCYSSSVHNTLTTHSRMIFPSEIPELFHYCWVLSSVSICMSCILAMKPHFISSIFHINTILSLFSSVLVMPLNPVSSAKIHTFRARPPSKKWFQDLHPSGASLITSSIPLPYPLQ